MLCDELERLDSERQMATVEWILQDARTQAASAGDPSAWALEYALAQALEREAREATRAYHQHRQRHGCAQ